MCLLYIHTHTHIHPPSEFIRIRKGIWMERSDTYIPPCWIQLRGPVEVKEKKKKTGVGCYIETAVVRSESHGHWTSWLPLNAISLSTGPNGTRYFIATRIRILSRSKAFPSFLFLSRKQQRGSTFFRSPVRFQPHQSHHLAIASSIQGRVVGINSRNVYAIGRLVHKLSQLETLGSRTTRLYIASYNIIY